MQALFYKLQKIIIYCVLPDFFVYSFAKKITNKITSDVYKRACNTQYTIIFYNLPKSACII